MAQPAASRLGPGTVVAGRYEIVTHLGAGGMGDVYEVEHRLLGRRFALKRLSPELGADAAMVERFLREARAAAATHHPGVVEVIDLGFADEGWPYLVMEKLVGETVRARLRRGPIAESEAIAIAAGVADALAAAHAVGVVHRDVKPENLWLEARGGVKVLDFGLALLVTNEATDLRLTRSGAVMGTPLYMSPEQARGHEIDARSDLYALGAVLYEMITGRPPFAAEAYSVLVAMILEDPPPPGPLAIASPGLRAVIERALAKRRDDRYGDAAALAQALRGVSDAKTTIGPGVRNAPRAVTDAPTMAAKIADLPPAPIEAVATAPTIATPVATEAPPTTTTPPPAPAIAARRVRGPWLIAGLVTISAVAVAIAIYATRSRAPVAAAIEPAAPHEGSGGGPWRAPLERGELARSLDEARREVLRHPDAPALLARTLLLELIADRPAAYARARGLAHRAAPADLAAAIDATAAMERGDPDAGADALAGWLRTAAPGSADELLLHLARATLYRNGDRFELARVEYQAILDRRPAFAPAVEPMVERLCFLGDDQSLAIAHAIVDAYVAAAPDSGDLELRVAEVAMGERRYRDALDRLDRARASGAMRDVEVDELRGDLHLLLDDVDGAIAAYDGVDDPMRRAEYTAGALLHADRTAEAARTLADAIRAFPPKGKASRLGKLVLDAALLALRTGDRDLAALAAGALPDGPDEAPAASARAFARAVVARLHGAPIDAAAFPMRERSPAYVLADSWGRADAAHLAALRDATDPAHVVFGVVATHVYPPLGYVRAQAEAAAGDRDAALAQLDRVLRPPHYDPTRGTVLVPALTLRAQLLEAAGRGGEAAAVRRELAKITAK